MAIVSNYGSAIGEAIGDSMEKALEVLLHKVTESLMMRLQPTSNGGIVLLRT